MLHTVHYEKLEVYENFEILLIVVVEKKKLFKAVNGSYKQTINQQLVQKMSYLEEATVDSLLLITIS